MSACAGIQGVLDAEPQPGLHGALKDLLKVIWGEACSRGASALLPAQTAEASELMNKTLSMTKPATQHDARCVSPRPALPGCCSARTRQRLAARSTWRCLRASRTALCTAGTRLVAVFMSSLMTPLPLMPLMPHLVGSSSCTSPSTAIAQLNSALLRNAARAHIPAPDIAPLLQPLPSNVHPLCVERTCRAHVPTCPFLTLPAAPAFPCRCCSCCRPARWPWCAPTARSAPPRCSHTRRPRLASRPSTRPCT